LPRRAGGVPSLTVAVSTRGARALLLDPAAWPAAPGVDYLVLVQEAGADPRVAPHLAALARRADVTVEPLASTGLARSRNAALALARGEVVLLADDDVTHPEGAFDAIRRFFRDHREAALLVGVSLDAAGVPRRRPLSRRLSRWNAGRAASHEIAFRAAAVRAAGVGFDERFGIGAGTPDFLGEEYIFLADGLAAGLVGRHRPLPVSVHAAPSTGDRWDGPAGRARAAVLARVFGRTAPLARLGFAIKNRRRFGSAADLLTFLRG
jgi:Glycosyl transferase family 2